MPGVSVEGVKTGGILSRTATSEDYSWLVGDCLLKTGLRRVRCHRADARVCASAGSHLASGSDWEADAESVSKARESLTFQGRQR